MRLKGFTVIEGNIGSGKTTLSKRIAEDFQSNLILEEFEENPFLKDFLKDQKTNSLGVELQFLIDRFHQLKHQFNNSNPTVSDYFIEKSLIFSKNNLSEIEKKLFDSYYSVLFEKTTKPDLLIYLSVSSDRLIKNIAKRGRKIEQELTKEYLENTNRSYLSHLKNSTEETVLILDVSQIDFVQNENHYNKLKNIISSKHQLGISHIKI